MLRHQDPALDIVEMDEGLVVVQAAQSLPVEGEVQYAGLLVQIVTQQGQCLSKDGAGLVLYGRCGESTLQSRDLHGSNGLRWGQNRTGLPFHHGKCQLIR